MYLLVIVYVALYALWFFCSLVFEGLMPKVKLNVEKWGDLSVISVVFALILFFLLGVLNSVDGFISSVIKTPFNWLAYQLNKSKLFSKKTRVELLDGATLANELCREAFKRFGLLAEAGELLKLFLKNQSALTSWVKGEFGKLWLLAVIISYGVPCSIAFLKINRISNFLTKQQEKIKKNIERLKKNNV